jgi:hypothetical protein
MSGNERSGNGSPAERTPRAAAPRKRPATRRTPPDASEQGGPDAAPFAPVKAQAANPDMWPAQPALWLQPELAPGIPASSGLTIVRQQRIPAPGFVEFTVEPNGNVHLALDTCDPAAPQLLTPLPHSGLAPLGWDPRTGADLNSGCGAKGLNQ